MVYDNDDINQLKNILNLQHQFANPIHLLYSLDFLNFYDQIKSHPLNQ